MNCMDLQSRPVPPRVRVICSWLANSLPLSAVIVSTPSFSGSSKAIVAAVTVLADLSLMRVETVKLVALSTMVTRAPLCPLADHQINLPVTHAPFFIDNSRALINADTVLNVSATCLIVAASLVRFSLATQVTKTDLHRILGLSKHVDRWFRG